MNVVVINGSPKGKNSITLQTVLFLEKRFTNTKFTVLNVGQQIKSLEKDMSTEIEAIDKSDVILFSYPVYTFIAPYQLHRFIELLKEQRVDLSDKFVTQITTSKHFYDVTAHKYVEENSIDLNAKIIKGLSADMEDLLTEKGQEEAIAFWKYVEFCVDNDMYEMIPKKKAAVQKPTYEKSLKNVDKKDEFEIAIVTNCEKDDVNLQNMIDDFMVAFPYKTKLINIREYQFSGGCLGCFNCAATGKCIYKDNFDSYLRNEIQTASSIVYAFTIKDHSMGASFKIYDDRQFCNGHRTVTMGMPIGYIISGDYQSESNLQMIIEGRAEVGHTFLASIATDECNTAQSLINLSKKLAFALENKTVLPQNFYGVGGMKIFRDLIYIMRGMMKADHKFYKKHGIYDFPQKKIGTILKMHLVGILISMPSVQKKMKDKMSDAMILPYKKVIDSNLDK